MATLTVTTRGQVRFCKDVIEAILAVLDAGGDFTDGVIALDSRWLGGDTFVSFDRWATRLLEQQGIPFRLLKSE